MSSSSLPFTSCRRVICFSKWIPEDGALFFATFSYCSTFSGATGY